MDGSGGDATGTDVQSLTEIQSYLANFNKDLSPASQVPQSFTILTTSDNNVVGLATTADQLYAGDGSGLVEQPKLKLEDGLDGASLVDQTAASLTASLTQVVSSQSQSGPVFTIQQPALAGGTKVGAATVQVMGSVADGGSIDPQQLLALQTSVSGGQPQLVAVGAPAQVQGQGTAAAIQSQQIVSIPNTGNNQIVAVEENEPQILQVQHPQEGTKPAQTSQSPGAATDTAVVSTPSSQADESVVVNTGNSYQTVTIVPSEVNQGGEVSYVLIVSQGDGDGDKGSQDEDMDMSVYDFKEEKGGTEIEDEDGNKRVVKFTPKKQGHTPMTTQLMCNYCNYTSPKRYLLTRHMKTHSEERPHKCHICDRGFKTMPSLQNHINTHTGVRPHKCKECDASFTTSGELVRHVRYRHTFEKPHKCPDCDYASVELSKLKRHMRSHTGERPYQCPHCSYASPDTYKLKRHLRIHTGEKPYECDICHSRFTQSNSLKAHKLIHTGNKPVFQCELCPTTCGRRTDLKIHVQKLHTSDKPLQCKKCGKSFPDRYTYKIHTKTHDGEKCFKCELCPYSALSQRHLESHILTHTGEKPFKCDECDQSFRQKQLLKRHKNLYHTPDYVPPPPRDKVHECTECTKTFAHRGNLLRHLVTHDPDNLELQQAIEEHMLQREQEGGEEEEEDEEEEEEEEGLEEGEMIATQGQLVGTGPDGVQLAEVNGQQVQVQLVSMGGEDGQQVYIQIGGAAVPTQTVTQAEVVMAATGMAATPQLEEEAPTIPADAITPEALSIIKQEPDDGQLTLKRVRTGARRHLQVEMEAVAAIGEALQDHSVEQVEEGIEPMAKRMRQAGDPNEQVNAEEEERKREEQKRKDIETCFGFDLEADEPQ